MTIDASAGIESPPPRRECWANCGGEVDEEMREIDRLEDELSPLPANITRIRKLISTLELCHHKAERWVTNIIEAIGKGDTSKGLGTRSAGESHPAERDWMNACTALSAWCAGQPAASVQINIGGRSASRLLSKLGQRSALKEWQVQRLIQRIREFVGWPRSMLHDDSVYVFMEECGADFEPPGSAECPEYYREHGDFWKQTIEMRIYDTVNGEPADISLAVAIDLMFPCNWNFVDNLDTVLGAIGGELHTAHPLAVCARNIRHAPICERMQTVCKTLQHSLRNHRLENDVDSTLLELLGDITAPKRWLVASLDKTIRLQLGW
ncbi:MAG: hypothetical protein GXX96_13270 [Planctomycetaceae bacterium]|nr:hypothetical protein [Planctomycetaceae bacterium]